MRRVWGLVVACIAVASGCLGPRVKRPPRVAVETQSGSAAKKTHAALRIVAKPESLSPTEVSFSKKADSPPTHRTLYVETHGGTFIQGADDSSHGVSSIVDGPTTIPPYEKSAAARTKTVACLRKMFARWNVTVTEDDPGPAPHLEVVLGGKPGALGLEADAGGVSPMYEDCSVVEQGITFVFTQILKTSQEECEVAAQELGHSLGLDHEYLCADPMTYLDGCGDKSFQNFDASCGANEPRSCACGGAKQNSVRSLDAVLGLATAAPPIALPPPATSASTSPPPPPPPQPSTSTSTKPPPPPEPPPSSDGAGPKIAPILPPAGAKLPSGSIVVVSGRVQDDVKLARVSLSWTIGGDVHEIDCAAPPKDVTCTPLFDTYTFQLPAGKGVRVWSIRAVDVAGRQSVSPERALTLGSGDAPTTPTPPPVGKGSAITVTSPESGSLYAFGATIPVRATVDGAVDSVQIVWSTPNGDEIHALEKLPDGAGWGVDLDVPQLTLPGPRILTVRVVSDGAIMSAPARLVTIVP